MKTGNPENLLLIFFTCLISIKFNDLLFLNKSCANEQMTIKRFFSSRLITSCFIEEDLLKQIEKAEFQI